MIRAMIIAFTTTSESFNPEKPKKTTGLKGLVSYRLLRIPDDPNYGLDATQFEVIDVDPNKLIQTIKAGNIEILNAKIEKDPQSGIEYLAGIKNQFIKYTRLRYNFNTPFGKTPLIVLKRIAVKKTGELLGYLVADYTGKVVKGSLQEVHTYVRNMGVANGRYVNKDYMENIYALDGTYPIIYVEQAKSINIPIKNNQQTEHNDNDTKNQTTETSKSNDNGKVMAVPKPLRFWSVSEFETFMQSHNYKYSITGAKLCGVDSRITDLVVPSGIKTIASFNMGSSDENKLVNIAIPSSVDDIWPESLYMANSIKHVYFDDDTKSISDNTVDCFECLDISFNIPKNVESLFGVFGENTGSPNNAYIVDLDKYEKLTEMTRCINSSDYIQVKSLGINLKSIYRSVTNIKIPIQNLRIPKTMHEISGSFTKITLYGLDFSGCSELTRISYGSFQIIDGLKRVDLSECEKLETIGDSCFSNCKDLEEVILPPNLQVIGSSAFSNCPKLTVIKLPDSVRKIELGAFNNTGISEIILPNEIKACELYSRKLRVIATNKKEVKEDLFFSACVAELVLPDEIEVFGRKCFNSAEIDLKIPSQLNRVKACAFAQFRSDILDFTGSKLTDVEECAFLDSKVKLVAFPDTLDFLGEKAFANNSCLEGVYLPESLKTIGARCFFKASSGTIAGLTVYTPAGSVAESYCKRNKIRVVNVNNAEEALLAMGIVKSAEDLKREMLDKNKTSVLSLMITGNNDYEDILNEEYRDNLLDLYNLKEGLLATVDPTVKLDTSRVTNIPETLYFKTNQNMTTLYPMGASPEHSDAVISYMNYLMTYDNVPELLDTPEFKEAVKNNVIECIARWGQELSIIRVYIMIDRAEYYVDLLIKNHNIIYTILRDRQFSSYAIHPSDITDFVVKYHGKPIEDLLIMGSSYTIDAQNNITEPFHMPRDINKKLTLALYGSTILIGGKELKQNAFGKYNHLARIYLLSVSTGKILKADAKVSSSLSRIKLRDIKGITLLEVKELSQLDVEDLSIIKSCDRRTYDKEFTHTLVNRAEYVRELRKQYNAYDQYAPCREFEVAKLLNNVGIDYELQHAAPDVFKKLNSSAIEAVFSTTYFKRVTKKKSVLAKALHDDRYSDGKLRYLGAAQLKDGKYLLVYKSDFDPPETTDIIGGIPRYLYTILSDPNSIPETMVMYMSNKQISTILMELTQMCVPSFSKDYAFITPEAINFKYLPYFLFEKCLAYSGGFGSGGSMYRKIILALGVHKSAGTISLISIDETYRSRYEPESIEAIAHVLMNFRSISEALKCCTFFFENQPDKILDNYRVSEITRGLALAHLSKDEIMKNNMDETMEYIVKLLQSHIPNGYPCTGIVKYFIDYAAKHI